MGQAMAPIGMGILGAGAVLATGGAALPAIGVGMAAMSAGSSIMGGLSQNSAYEAQAAQYQQQARLSMLQAKVDEAQRLTSLNRALGTNKATAAAMNIDVDSPSAVAIADYNKDQVIAQIGLNRLSAETQVTRMQIAAGQDLSAGTSAIMSGLMQGGTSIFGGVMDYTKIGGPSSTVPAMGDASTAFGGTH